MAGNGTGNKKTKGDPIDVAIRDGRYDLLDRLLQEKPDSKKAVCNSLVRSAVVEGNASLVTVLLRHGADNLDDHLDIACDRGHEAVVSLLLRHGADPECEWAEEHDPDEICHIRPLHYAARKGHAGMVRALLDAGASARVAVEIEEFFPNFYGGEEYNINRYTAESVLDLAAQRGHADIIKEIAKQEPSIVSRSTAQRTGFTALHYAAKHSQVGSIDALVDAGADLEARDNRGDTALHTATESRNWKATLLALLRHGANIDAQNTSRRTPLHKTIAEDNMAAAGILVSAGADLNLTLLAFSSQTENGSNVSATRTLLGYGADVNAKRASDGNTPLHFAAKACSDSKVEILLKMGGDEMAVNDQGLTPAEMVNRLALPSSRLDKVLALLANAPRDRAERAWSRRGFFVLCRTFPSRMRLSLAPPENRDNEEGALASAAGCHPMAHREAPPNIPTKGGGEEGQPEGVKTEGPTEFSAAMRRLMGLEADVIFRKVVEFL